MNIIVIANKTWEAAPLVAVLENPDARPSELVSSEIPASFNVRPRLRLKCHQSLVEVWCIQDLMDRSLGTSSSFEKARILPRVCEVSKAVDVVISFGTCASPLSGANNGSVVVGSSVFVHDPWEQPPDPYHHWRSKQLDEIVPSDGERWVRAAASLPLKDVTARILTTPSAPAPKFELLAGAEYVATGVVNVTKTDDYAWADERALERFNRARGNRTVASHETTHGLVRLVLERPFLYVSGIANAVGRYDQEVKPNRFAQNWAAASNAAVVLAFLVCEIARQEAG